MHNIPIMRNKLFLLISAFTLIISACTTPGRFKSDVDTTKKPWTNLNFNKVVVDENTLVRRANVCANALKKGFHPIRIEFLEKIGNQRLRVYIKKSGSKDWVQMEAGHFFHNCLLS